jgi:hypothetical protein
MNDVITINMNCIILDYFDFMRCLEHWYFDDVYEVHWQSIIAIWLPKVKMVMDLTMLYLQVLTKVEYIFCLVPKIWLALRISGSASSLALQNHQFSFENHLEAC